MQKRRGWSVVLNEKGKTKKVYHLAETSYFHV